MNYFIRTIAAIIWIFWGGFVISQLWGWFVVPLGVPAINTAHAAGLLLTLSLTRSMDYSNVSAATHDAFLHKATPLVKHMSIIGLIVSVLSPALGLLVGWIIQNFA